MRIHILIYIFSLNLLLVGCDDLLHKSDLKNQKISALIFPEYNFYEVDKLNHPIGFNAEFIQRIQKDFSMEFIPHVPIENDRLNKSWENFFAPTSNDAILIANYKIKTSDKSGVTLKIDESSEEHYCSRVEGEENLFSCYPQTKSYLFSFKVSDEDEFVWIIKGSAYTLWKNLSTWPDLVRNLIYLSNLYEKYFSHLGLFNKFEIFVFRKKYLSEFPKFKNFFLNVGEEFNLDPLLIAAMSYQESHWNPLAISPTGVRGMMMLTQSTAKSLGVTNRLDPKQSIWGGAKYFQQIKGQLPAEIVHPDLLWFSFASYNVGLSHVTDAQQILIDEKQDKNLWMNLRNVLPRLSDPRYYKNLKHGKARGNEPVRYVDSIRNYYTQLKKLEEAKN